MTLLTSLIRILRGFPQIFTHGTVFASISVFTAGEKDAETDLLVVFPLRGTENNKLKPYGVQMNPKEYVFFGCVQASRRNRNRGYFFSALSAEKK